MPEFSPYFSLVILLVTFLGAVVQFILGNDYKKCVLIVAAGIIIALAPLSLKSMSDEGSSAAAQAK